MRTRSLRRLTFVAAIAASFALLAFATKQTDIGWADKARPE